jgi:uncharacterized membrane protein YkvA (DUF1232 family)
MRLPQVPWYIKGIALFVVGYALSPIDLIPDFIPIIGYLDDLIIVPLGILLVVRLLPAELMAQCRAEAIGRSTPGANWITGAIIINLWCQRQHKTDPLASNSAR